MKNERLNNSFLLLFIVGVCLNCLFYTKLALDFTLVPRFVFLSFFMFSVAVTAFFYKKKLYGNFLFLPLVVFVTWVCFSNLWAVNTSLSVIESGKQVLYLLYLLVLFQFLNWNAEKCLSFFIKGVTVLFFISFILFYFQYGETNGSGRAELYHIIGVCGHKNLYSSFIFLCLIFAMLGLYSLSFSWKKLCGLAIVLQCIVIFLLQSRAVWIGLMFFAVSLFILFLLKKRLKKLDLKLMYLWVGISLIVVNLFIYIVFPHLITIYQKNHPKDYKNYNQENISDLSTFSERTFVWSKTYEIIKQEPVLGVGANNWQIHFPRFTLPEVWLITDQNVTYQRPHNDFLWILAEYGFVGFNIWLLFYLSIIFLLLRRIFNAKSIVDTIVLLGILSYFLISFTDFPKERIGHNLLFFGLIGVAVNDISQDFNDSSNFRLSSNYFIIIALFAGFIGYAAIQNFKGEYYTKKMELSRSEKKQEDIVKYSSWALSPFYTIDPTSQPLLWYRGNAFIKLGYSREAFKDFLKASKQHPYNHFVMNDLGSAYYTFSMTDSAKYYYFKAAFINPRFDEPKLNLTAIFINEGNYKEAMKWNESIFHESERRSLYRKIIQENQ